MDGTIAVIQTINPSPTNITWQLNGRNLVLSWPADQIGWQLQVQTNGMGTGLSTNWSNVSGSLTTNVWVVPIDEGSPAVFYRLALL
jgi:hypothetical protein